VCVHVCVDAKDDAGKFTKTPTYKVLS